MPMWIDAYDYFHHSLSYPNQLVSQPVWDRNRFSLRTHENVPCVSVRLLRSGWRYHFVFEFDGGPAHFSDSNPDNNVIVIDDFPSVSHPNFDNRQEEPLLLEAFVSESVSPAPVSSRHFEPIEVIRIVGVAHLVGFTVAHADWRFDPLGIQHAASVSHRRSAMLKFMAVTALDELWDVVRSIPPGRVMSYGEVGSLLRPPVGGRTVGRWMAHAPEGVPWWRVVAKTGHLPISKRGPGFATTQEQLLRQEGTPFVESGKVDMSRAQHY